MAEFATSSDRPSESMDVDIDKYAMQQYAEYVYGSQRYPSRMKILTGKGDPDKIFKALATFEKLQDEKLVLRIKEDIKVEYTKNPTKAASCMCLALTSNRPEMAADAMKHIPANDGPESRSAFEKAQISAETAAVSKLWVKYMLMEQGIAQHYLLLVIQLVSHYQARLPGDRGLWHFVSVLFLDKLGLPQEGTSTGR